MTIKITLRYLSILLFINSLILYSNNEITPANSPETVTINTDGNKVILLSSQNGYEKIEYRVGEFKKYPVEINGEVYYKIRIEKEGKLYEKGNPELPIISRSIIIPGDAKMAAKVIKSDYTEINMKIAPSKGILPRSINPKEVPYTFSDIYSKDEFFPTEKVNLGSPYIMKDFRGITVYIYPFAYNPVREVLRIYTNIVIEVKKIGPGKKNVMIKESSKPDKYFSEIYRNRFINYKKLRSPDEDGRMIVICYNEFVDEIQPYVDWKNEKGIPTTVILISNETKEEIKDTILAEYNTGGLTFVQIVGDADQVPTFMYGWSPPDTGGADIFYSFLAGDDHIPDILVGRFSAEDTLEVETQVERTIYYERDMQEASWFHKGMGIASTADWGHIRSIRTDLLTYHYQKVDELYDGSQGPIDDPGDPSNTAVSDSINKGRSIINYCGHGSATAWKTSLFSISDVNALTNDYKLPFIFSAACLNGDFVDNKCFAETWLLAENEGNPTGAIGFYGASISTDYETPPDLQEAFNDLLVSNDKLTFGGLCFSACCKVMDDYPNCWPFLMNFNIFGDASLYVIPHVNIPANLVLQNITVEIDSTKNYQAFNSITAAGDSTYFIIEGSGSNGGFCTMQAGNYIVLQSGFAAKSGCHFWAYNDNPVLSGDPLAIDYEPDKKITEPETKEDKKEDIPKVFSCNQNYPNPFRGSTIIKYGLPKASKVNLEIYNLVGQKIRKLIDAQQPAGFKTARWDGRTDAGREVPQGIYFYTLEAGDEFKQTYKMIVVK